MAAASTRTPTAIPIHRPVKLFGSAGAAALTAELPGAAAAAVECDANAAGA